MFEESAVMGYVLYEFYKLIGFVTVWAVLMILSAFITVRTFTLMPMSVFPYPGLRALRILQAYRLCNRMGRAYDPVRFYHRSYIYLDANVSLSVPGALWLSSRFKILSSRRTSQAYC